MNLLRMIQMWMGTSDEAVFEADDNGNGNSGGNSSIWFNHVAKARANAPTASLEHHPGTVAWVGRPYRQRGQFKLRVRYDTPAARAEALARLKIEGRLAKLTVPVIPRNASPLEENSPAEVGLRW